MRAPGQTSAPLSIKQFLNTTDPIWTYNSTENTTILCKVDQKIGITNESYSFNRSYYSGYLNWTVRNGQGTFESADTVQLNITLQEYNETLLFTDNYNSCAIIRVTSVNP
ncbi:hypothetical protein MRX96_050555, partial [Rhipicephalus microplus]